MTDDDKLHDVAVLDVVALLDGDPEKDLVRGQVGTVVELLEKRIALVEFSDDEGRAYAIVPRAYDELLVLRYEPQEAAL